jgi:folylpolyglutamate synthase/dihydropteroate synthase
LRSQCPFFIVPAEISAYQWSKPQSLLQFGIAGRHQISNVSLALQITRIWLHSNSKQHQQKNNSQLLNGNIISNNILVDPTEKGSEQLSGFTVSKETLTALEDCRWPGRSQIIHRSPITYFLGICSINLI